jgi:syntaxin 1B/2/3
MSADLLAVARDPGGKRGKGVRALPPPDIEAGGDEEEAGPPPVESGVMGVFFAEVSAIKALLEGIRRCLHRLEAANDESKTATKASRIADIRERMENDVSEVGMKANETKKRLEALEKANEDARSKRGCGSGSSQDRTRTSITLSLHKKMRDLMASFSELRGKFQAEYKEVVERRYFAIYGKKARRCLCAGWRASCICTPAPAAPDVLMAAALTQTRTLARSHAGGRVSD